MRQFSFETNIQERMPWNGKVFYVKRMTSDYAECYPFDVDGFIEDIYQKYQQVAADDPRLAAWAKTREELRRQWVKTLSVTRPSGDATIYPNRDGRQEPALMEVWHKAGDYWRTGLRIGDTLPKIVPPCRITRLPEGGWIALFPNEMHLLESRQETTEATEMALAFDEPQDEEESNLPKIDDGGDDSANDFDNDLESVSMIDAMAEDATEASAAESAACETENSVLADDEHAVDGHSVPTEEAVPVCSSTERERNAEQRRRRREQREAQRRSYVERLEREAREAEEYAREQERRKIFAAVGAVAVTAVMIYFFGLLGPAVFGLLCGGLLKG